MNLSLRKLLVGCLTATLLLASCTAQRPENVTPAPGSGENPPATETAAPPSGEQGDPGNQEGDEPSDIIYPVLLPEEERETKLESLLSFKIGSDGLFSYFWYPCEDGIEHSAPEESFDWCADSENRIYMVLNERSKREGDILRLNDGKVYERPQDHVYPRLIECIGKTLYVTNDVFCADGNEFMTLDTESGEWQMLTVPETLSGKNVSLEVRDGNAYWYSGGVLYTLSGERLPKEGLSVTEFRLDEESGGLLLEKGNEKGLLLDKANIMPLLEGYTDYEDSKLLVRSHYRNEGEKVFFQFDGIYRLTSEFMVTRTSRVTQPCSFSFEPYEGSETVTLETYESRTVKIGAYVFEDVISDRIFFGEDRTMYLAVFYLDHGDLYKVLPGYENFSFAEETEQTDLTGKA